MKGFSVLGYLQAIAAEIGENFPDYRIVCGLEPAPDSDLKKTIFPCIYVYASGYNWALGGAININLNIVFGRRGDSFRDNEKQNSEDIKTYTAVVLDTERIYKFIREKCYIIGGLRVLSADVQTPPDQPRPVFFAACRLSAEAPALDAPDVDDFPEVEIDAEKTIENNTDSVRA